MVNKTLTPEDEVKKRQIYKLANWELILRNSGPLNNSIDWINELHKTGMFNMASLTHCNSTNEALNKTKLIANEAPYLKVIPVMKPASKTTVVDARGAILVDDFGGNLREWKAEGGISIKFSLKEESNNGFYNITSLREIRDIMSIIKMNEELHNGSPVKTIKQNNNY